MQTGIRLKCHPTADQKRTLSQWMGCARVVWNAKCDEHRYMHAFARKFEPLGVFAPIDQTYSQFKDDDLTPWLSECPSQILRNSAVNWYRTYQKFFKNQCKRPVRKKKTDRASIHLTRELFRFEPGPYGRLDVFIGTKTNNVGLLRVNAHRAFGSPNSIYLVKEAGDWYVSFSYDDGRKTASTEIEVFADLEEQLAWLRSKGHAWLEANIAGHDRGAVIPVHSPDAAHDFTPQQKRTKRRASKKARRNQRRIARQVKGSHRRNRTKLRLARNHAKIGRVRKDFAHKTSRAIVDAPALINVFENMKLARMAKRPKAKKDEHGRFLPNGAAAKAALNKVMAEPGLGMIAEYARYKSERAGKLLLFVPPQYTSQECACCGYVHEDNRRTQSLFECGSCGHRDNADHNASIVIGKRAVQYLVDPGMGLSSRGVLSKSAATPLDTGRGVEDKTDGASVAPSALGQEASKKKPTAKPYMRRPKPEAEARSFRAE